jgi:membrane protease subunit (stomatin/prohibitin family)
MGILDAFSSQFIEVIEWPDARPDDLVFQFPVRGREIKMGAQCVVRESQAAVFFRDGKALDVFGPGRHTITTANVPLLTKLLSLPFGFNSPFKAEVVFVNVREFTDQKWGTPAPVMVRDPEFGPLRLRAFGTYSFQVSDPQLFVNKVVGVQNVFSTDPIANFLRQAIVTRFVDLLGELKIPALDLASRYDELSAAGRAKVEQDFLQYGVRVKAFYLQSITLPEEVEKALDKRSQMGVLGDMGRYTQFQTAEAIRDAAKNEGGGSLAGMGAGIGAGAAIGQAMANAMAGGRPPAGGPGGSTTGGAGGSTGGGGGGIAPGASEAAGVCPQGHATPPRARFCPTCGTAIVAAAASGFCSNCGTEIPSGGKFCPGCGKAVA